MYWPVHGYMEVEVAGTAVPSPARRAGRWRCKLVRRGTTRLQRRGRAPANNPGRGGSVRGWRRGRGGWRRRSGRGHLLAQQQDLGEGCVGAAPRLPRRRGGGGRWSGAGAQRLSRCCCERRRGGGAVPSTITRPPHHREAEKRGVQAEKEVAWSSRGLRREP